MRFPLSDASIPALMYAVPVMAIACAAAYTALGVRAAGFRRGLLGAGLAATVGVAFLNYTNVQWRIGDYFNEYEFYHYYIGAKYHAECGYTGMYRASVIADAENGGRKPVATIRDLDTGRTAPAAPLLAAPDAVKARFSPARWQALKDDIAFFRARISQGQWQKQLTDKGYNASPVWTLVGGGIANLVPGTNVRGMYLLPWIDVGLIALAMAAVAWAYGLRTAGFMLALLGCHMLMSHSHLKAAFLRLDWLAALVGAVCCLKRGRHAAAGALVGYAAMVRVFPVIFAFGMGAKWLYGVAAARTWRGPHFRFLAAMAAAMAALLLISALYAGVGYWQEFLSKIGRHNDDISAWRVGFKYVFLMSYDGSAYWGRPLAEVFADRAALWWTIQAAALTLCFRSVRDLDDDEALAFGYVPVFFLVAPTYYYHVMLLAALLFFAPRIERPTRLAGVVYLFATSMIAQHYYVLWDRTYALFFLNSCLLFAFVLYMIALGLMAKRVPAA